MKRRLKGASKASAILLDQILYASATLVISSFAARSLTVTDFGLFAVVTFGWSLSIGLSRTVGGELLLIQEASGSEGWRTERNGALVRTLSVATVWSAVLILAALTLSSSPTVTILTCICSPATFLRDYFRYRQLRSTPWRAVGSEATTLAVIFAIVLPQAMSNSSTDAGTFLLIYSLGSLHSIPSAVREFRSVTRDDWSWSGDHRRYAVDYLLGTLSLQATLYVATAIVGVKAAAGLRGADLLIGPARIMVQAGSVSVAQMVGRGLTKQALKCLYGVSSLLVATSLALYYVLLNKFDLGPLLLGQSWKVAQGALPFAMAALCFVTTTVVSALVLKARGRGQWLLRARIALVPVGIVASSAGSFFGGVQGAAIAALFTSVCAAMLWALLALKALDGTPR